MYASTAYTHGDSRNVGSFGYVDPYIVVLNDFYKHSECRTTPYATLMNHMNDAEFTTGEALYKRVRSGNIQWDYLGDFNSMDYCHRANLKRQELR